MVGYRHSVDTQFRLSLTVFKSFTKIDFNGIEAPPSGKVERLIRLSVSGLSTLFFHLEPFELFTIVTPLIRICVMWHRMEMTLPIDRKPTISKHFQFLQTAIFNTLKIIDTFLSMPNGGEQHSATMGRPRLGITSLSHSLSQFCIGCPLKPFFQQLPFKSY